MNELEGLLKSKSTRTCLILDSNSDLYCPASYIGDKIKTTSCSDCIFYKNREAILRLKELIPILLID